MWTCGPALSSIPLAQNAAPSAGALRPAVPVAALFLLVLLILAAGAAVVLIRRRLGRRAGGTEPTCGRCGYIVQGLTTFTCPECGSDLREVGIVRGSRSAARRPPGLTATFFRVVGWKLALFAAVYLTAALFGIDYYEAHLLTRTYAERVELTAAPASGQYDSVVVNLTHQYTRRGYVRQPLLDHRLATVDVQKGPTRIVFTHDPATGTNTYRDAAGATHTSTAPLAGELRAWMTANGINGNDRRVGAELDAIAAAINQSDKPNVAWDLLVNQSQPYFRSTSSGTFTDPVSRVPFFELATVAAIALGLLVLAWIWLRNRRALAAALARVTGGEAPASSGATAPRAPPAAAAPAHGAPSVRTLSVMFSDVKDYTARAAQESRLGILDLVRRHRDLVQPIVKRRGGRVVKSLGDGLLITFESATDAVIAGLEIQAAAAAHSKDAFADRDKVELRIAVSTGEVAEHDGDVFGESVNLASRAQQQAGPGEVLFTESTFATINRREVRWAEVGAFELKGIAEPVRLFRALPQAGVAAEQQS